MYAGTTAGSVALDVMTQIGLPMRSAIASATARGLRIEAWHLVALGGLVATGGYFLLPRGLPQAVFYLMVGTAAVVAMTVGMSVHRPQRLWAWVLLAIGQACWVVADLIFTLFELSGRTPFPSIADVVYIAAYPIIGLGVLLLIRGRDADGKAGLIDTLIVTVGVGAAAWITVIGPLFADQGIGFWELAISVAYPAMDLLLLAVAARLIFSSSLGSMAHRFLLASLLLVLVTDIGFTLATLGEGYASGDALDAGWLLAYVAIGVAAVHPSVALPEPDERPMRALAPHRLFLLAIATLVGPGLLLAESVANDSDDLAIAIGTVVVASLVLGRLVSITASWRRSELRFRALVQNATDVYSILGDDATTLYASPAVENVLGYRPEQLVGRNSIELVHPEEAPFARRLLTELLASRGAEFTTQLRLRRADGTWCVAEVTGKNLVHESSVGGVVINYRDITERRSLEEQLRHQAFHDPLTGLPNRALFMDRLEHALERSLRRGDTSLAVLFLDLDDFKAVNDGLGHAAGDEALAVVAERLRSCVRAEDTAARVGGDEFAFLLEERVTLRAAERIADRIMDALRPPVIVQGRAMPMRGSIGIALAGPGSGEAHVTADVLLRNADMAMYQAKLAGKGRYEVFQASMHGAAVARLQLRTDLERAVERGEFALHYQPFIDLRSGAVRGAEALLRWNHPERGVIAPGEFLASAEEGGLIVSIGRWVVSEACRQAGDWLTDGTWRASTDEAAPMMSVNLSVSQLTDAGLVDHLDDVLQQSGLDPGQLVLEITESMLLADTEERIGELNRLKRLGVRLAIDDFGIGYSSFNYLRRLPVDTLKLDRAFVARLEENAGDRTVARAIIELGGTLGLQVIAEGIETEAQRSILLDLGCTIGQGYLFGRPAPA